MAIRARIGTASGAASSDEKARAAVSVDFNPQGFTRWRTRGEIDVVPAPRRKRDGAGVYKAAEFRISRRDEIAQPSPSSLKERYDLGRNLGAQLHGDAGRVGDVAMSGPILCARLPR